MGDEVFERDEDGRPVFPGDNADVATKHAYNVAMAEWLEEHPNEDGEVAPTPATEDGT